VSLAIVALDALGGLCLALGALLLVIGKKPLPFGSRARSHLGARFHGAASAVLGIVLLAVSTGTGRPVVAIVGSFVYAALLVIALLADSRARRRFRSS
jgi:hypothetical protein